MIFDNFHKINRAANTVIISGYNNSNLPCKIPTRLKRIILSTKNYYARGVQKNIIKNYSK